MRAPVSSVIGSVALALLASACGGGDAPSSVASPRVQDTSAVVDEFDPPSELAMSDPAPTSDHDLDLDEVTMATTVYSVTADPGTEWEIPFHIAVPSGWTFSAANPGFSDGVSSITLATGCDGPCEIKHWDTVLYEGDGFLGRAMAEFPAGAALAFSSSESSSQFRSSVAFEGDDGTGTSATAVFRPDGGRYLGCTATAAAGTPLAELQAICEAIAADWTTVLASTPAARSETVTTDEVSAMLAEPDTDQVRDVIPLDDNDPAFTVGIALPELATWGEPFLGVPVRLDGSYSVFSEMELDTGCDGTCGPQDWEAKLNAPVGPLGERRLILEVENDTAIDAGWLLTGRLDDEYKIFVLRWDDAADKYFECRVELDERDFDRVDEMIAVCLSARPSWISW